MTATHDRPAVTDTPPWRRNLDAVVLRTTPEGYTTWRYLAPDGTVLADGGVFLDRWDAIEAAARVTGTWTAGLASTLTSGAFVHRGKPRDTRAVTLIDPMTPRGVYRKAPTR